MPAARLPGLVGQRQAVQLLWEGWYLVAGRVEPLIPKPLVRGAPAVILSGDWLGRGRCRVSHDLLSLCLGRTPTNVEDREEEGEARGRDELGGGEKLRRATGTPLNRSLAAAELRAPPTQGGGGPCKSPAHALRWRQCCAHSHC